MKDVIFLIFHLLTTMAKLLQPGGSRAIIAEKMPPQPDALDDPVASHLPQALLPHHHRRVARFVGCDWSF
jgi:hypothetical protein